MLNDWDQFVKSINVDIKDRSYKIFVGKNSVQSLPVHLDSSDIGNQITIISTPPVADLYLSSTLGLLKNYKQVEYFLVPVGEEFKSLQKAEEIYTWLW